MFFWMWAILVTISIEPILATLGKYPKDYSNEISMLCSFNKTENGSLYLHIRENEKISLHLSELGKHRKIIFYINGYGEDMNPDDDGSTLKYFYELTRDLITDDQTVVCAFDFVHKKNTQIWDHFADYQPTVLKRVPFAAKIIANVASQMYMNKVFEHFEDFQIIGFSLGTHVAGVTARLLRNAFGETVPRIFALDPARRFVFNSESQLKKTDAKYIQAIFTSTISQQNIDVHCKVFINDGANQPGCAFIKLVEQITCCHNFLPKFYKEMFEEKKKLIAYRDPDQNGKDETIPKAMIVGHLSPENVKGVFFANTDGTKIKKLRSRKFFGLIG